MTADEIKRRFPNASRSFIAANLSPDNSGTAAKLESNPGHAPLVAKEVQRQAGQRFLVCVESVRKRLLDQDNLCEKFHVDLLRYSGVIPDDSPGQVQIEVRQRKTTKGETEHSVITVTAK